MKKLEAEHVVGPVFILSFSLCVLVGCSMSVDPATGDKTYAIDPNHPAVPIAEVVAEGGGAVAPLFGPIGAAVGSLLLGGLGVWRKMKPELIKQKTKAQHSHAAAAVTVTAMERWKDEHPDQWAALGEKVTSELSKQGVDPTIVENVIRGLRGKPPKE